MDTTWEIIEALAKKHGAKYPQLVAAQWALESGWGKSLSGKNNFFGIKGTGTKHQTQEWVGEKFITIIDEFQDFASPDECVKYLVDRWYKNFKTYKGVNNAPSVEEAAKELVRQKYATDPTYAEKLIGILKKRTSTNPSPKTVMIGPKRTPKEFGFKPGDHHLIVNDITETVKAFDFSGKLLWEVPGLARGQGSDFEFKLPRTDTPPGLYRIGAVYRDYDRVGANPSYDRTLMSYGWYSFDLEELENQERKYNRAGILIHGGGSACGWPGAWAPMQKLFATHGCVRMHNKHLRENLMPLTKTGKVFVSVYQEG